MDAYTWDDLCADLSELIDAGLVAVTGRYPDLRFCLTLDGEITANLYDDYDRAVAAEARELAVARHAAEGNVLQLFGTDRPPC
jgi:cobalamin biosynthesis protein CbiG